MWPGAEAATGDTYTTASHSRYPSPDARHTAFDAGNAAHVENDSLTHTGEETLTRQHRPVCIARRSIAGRE